MDAVELIKEWSTHVVPLLEESRRWINHQCVGLEAWQVIFFTVSATLLAVWIQNFLFGHQKSAWQRLKEWFFRTLRRMPFVGGKIAGELKKVVDDIKNDPIFARRKGEIVTAKLPAKGLGKKAVLDRVAAMDELLGGADWEGGRVSGAVYGSDPELHKCLVDVYGRFAWSNPLHPDVFPAVRKMEGEVVKMCVHMFHGSEEACGSMTSGGTESILMACRAYRQWGYERGITMPEMVVPETAHCAFDKAAEYFRMKIVHVPVDEQTRRCDMRAMRRAINRNTVMLVGSAPQYPHGIIDSIEDIAKLAQSKGIGVHVDCCLGGFIVPFLEEAGFNVRPFDFRVPGVTSISADTHKYGYAPKGSSVVLYSNQELRHLQYFVAPDWPGGIYASPTVAGSRAGGIIAACWAAMMFTGRDGYVESTRKIMTVTQKITKALREVDGIFVFGEPESSVVAFGSKDFDIFRLGSELTKLGWNLNNLQFPSGIHLCVTLRHTEKGLADQFIGDVRRCTAEIMKEPKTKATGSAAIYGMAQSIPDRSLVKEIAWGFLDTCLAVDEK